MRYAAFLSYSHADARWAKWLMRRLESYRVPSRLVGTQGAHGPIGSRLGKIFRDRDDLPTAGDLGDTIREALAASDALVVICSPKAAQSRWVNAEADAFRALGRGDRIACFIVEGDPGSQDPASACFPAATTAPGADGMPREPLAADARKAGDGRERAFLKLVAGLLGVSYDALAQREAQRRHQRMFAIASAAVVGMAIAIGLAATAYVARNDAQRRQAQAEDILGFMLGDLREKLTTVGRLDLMRAVDDKATGYFATLEPRDLSDRALEEQARSLTGIGQVRLAEGNHEEATAAFREALERSEALLERQPRNGQRLFDFAQAEYWIGLVAFQQGRLDDAETWLTRYRDSAIRLATMNPENFDWQREVVYGHHNLAALEEKRGRYDSAERSMREELALYRTWTRRYPDDTALRYEAANVVSWLGSLMLRQGRLDEAVELHAEEVAAFARNAAVEPDNMRWKRHQLGAAILQAEAQTLLGRDAEARANIQGACVLARQLTDTDPSNNDWRELFGICQWWQAQLARRAGELSLAGTLARQATETLSRAHAAERKDEAVSTWLARSHQLLAQLALADGVDSEVPGVHLKAARALLAPAFKAKQNERLRIVLADTHLIEGAAAEARGEAGRARLHWLAARDLLQQGSTDVPFPRLESLARALAALDQVEQAEPLMRRLQAADYVPLQPFPDSLLAVAHQAAPPAPGR